MTWKHLMVVVVSMLAVAASAPLEAQESSLDAAYRRELAFLTTELRALERQKEEVDTEFQSRVTAGRNELERLQQRLGKMESRSEELDRELRLLDEGSEKAVERADTLLNVVEQARASLGERNIEIDANLDTEPALRAAFDAAGRLAAKRGSFRVATEKFFARNGREIEGRVARLGAIGAWGEGDGEAGALVPLPGGGMQISSHELGAEARAIIEGAQPSGLLPVVLYDRSGAASERKSKSLVEFVSSGGVIGWIIVVLGVVGLILGVVRIWLLKRLTSDGEAMIAALGPTVRERDFETAAAKAKALDGAAARVLSKVIPQLPRGSEQVENAAGEAILKELPAFERFGAVIMVIAAVAPLLGLLGTVTGMISTFDVITEYGTGDPKMLSGGISEALVTTELGLIVAIPALMLANLLGAWSQRMIGEIEKAVLHLANIAGTPVGEALAPAEDAPVGAGTQEA